MSEDMNFEELAKSVKASVQSNIDLIKLESVERTSVVGSSTSVIVIVGFFFFLFVFFFSLFAGYFLSVYFKDTYTGFAFVACFYLLICVILILFRKGLIETPMRNKIIRNIFKK